MPEYISTRGGAPTVTASQAIINGIAPDGGLYVPNAWPTLNLAWDQLAQADYQTIAKLVFTAFLSDFTPEEIDAVINAAYGDQWDTPTIAPLHTTGNTTILELFHGPTLAFKDVALQALPHLLTTAAKKAQIKNDILILAATSGDTGTAAMAGFGDVEHTQIVVFYPEVGVSEIQRQQMVTEPAKNAHVIALTGNFDDAQTAVKTLFADTELAEQLADHNIQFSSANSINIGRLIPQISYYFYAYAQLVANQTIKAGDEIEIVVPTGNFGNVLAAYYAQQIGLPVARFVVASNENNVLTDFFTTGTYDRRREFHVSSSPAMDILVSSNLERLLYFASGQNSALIKTYMADLAEQGFYTLDATTKAGLTQFNAGFASNDDTAATINNTFKQADYLLDPHTAVGVHVAQQVGAPLGQHRLIAATASPFKFPQTVLAALEQTPKHGFAGVEQLAQVTNRVIPSQIATLFDQPILHKQVISAEAIKATLQTELF